MSTSPPPHAYSFDFCDQAMSHRAVLSKCHPNGRFSDVVLNNRVLVFFYSWCCFCDGQSVFPAAVDGRGRAAGESAPQLRSVPQPPETFLRGVCVWTVEEAGGAGAGAAVPAAVVYVVVWLWLCWKYVANLPRECCVCLLVLLHCFRTNTAVMFEDFVFSCPPCSWHSLAWENKREILTRDLSKELPGKNKLFIARPWAQ